MTDLSALRDYQLEGVKFLSSTPRALLADDPGSGKSVQALKAASMTGRSRLLILCPAVGAVSWPQQINLWQDDKSAVTICWNDKTNALGIPDGPVNLIVAFGQLIAHRDKLLFSLERSEPFDCCIIDECHYLKSRSAKRTKFAYGHSLDTSKPSSLLHYLSPEAPVWIMSGTPWPNNFSEFFPHAVALMPDVVQTLFHTPRVSYGQWIMTLCNTADRGHGGGAQPTSTKKTAIPAIRNAIAPVMLRRQKKHILPQLKEPQYFDEPIAQSVPEHWDAEMMELLRQTGWDGTDATLVPALDLLSRIEPSISRRRLVLGETKAKPAADWCAEYLNNSADEQKLVVFAHHKSLIKALIAALAKYNPACIAGDTATQMRSDEVNRFQEDERCRVFIGQTLAAGTSITLTGTNTVAIVEPDWVPGNNVQAISRVHRLGQLRDVFVYWLSAPGTLDHRIMSVIRHKSKDIAATLGDT